MADVGVEAAQDLLAAVELGHRTAQAVKDPGELDGDVAAADHGDVVRQHLQVERLVRGDGMLDPGNVRQ